MDESTPIAPREAVQRSLELLFMNQIRPRVIKASHVLLLSFFLLSFFYIHELSQLDFTSVITNLGNSEGREKDDTGSQIHGSTIRSQTTVEREWQDSTMCEAKADLDLLTHDLDSEFGNSSGSEILEPDILVF